DLAEVLATPTSDILGRLERTQRFHGRMDDVVRIAGAENLAQDVLDSCRLEHGANRAAGDDARTGAGRAEQDVACARMTDHPVGDGPVHERDAHQALLRSLVALADGIGHLVGLAETNADVALAVS